MRLNKKHRPFKKGYLPGWTEEVFVVTHVRRRPVVTYRLSEWDGTPIKGTFYEPDVQKVQVSDDSLFRVEKVLKRKLRTPGVGAVERVRRLDTRSTQSWFASNKKRPVKKSPGWTKYRPKTVDLGRVTRPRPPRTRTFSSSSPRKPPTKERTGNWSGGKNWRVPPKNNGRTPMPIIGRKSMPVNGVLWVRIKRRNKNVDAPRVIRPCARRNPPNKKPA